MKITQPITPCLWFDGNIEAVAEFYTSIFENSCITDISRYPDAGQDVHGHAVGDALTVSFELDGQPFTALNGGSHFKISEAISFQVMCDTQEAIDYYWERLGEGGDPDAEQCGWLKDKFGVSWQIVPSMMGELMSHPDPDKSRRTMEAMLKMKKLDIAELKAA